MWGKYDASFTVGGAQAYKRDVQVHILEAGHFGLDEKAGEIIALTDDFLTTRTKNKVFARTPILDGRSEPNNV
jgi:hypothetical protein